MRNLIKNMLNEEINSTYSKAEKYLSKNGTGKVFTYETKDRFNKIKMKFKIKNFKFTRDFVTVEIEVYEIYVDLTDPTEEVSQYEWELVRPNSHMFDIGDIVLVTMTEFVNQLLSKYFGIKNTHVLVSKYNYGGRSTQ